MATKLIWGKDLYKGFKLDTTTQLLGSIDDILPFQMLTMEEKTDDWIRAVADYYEVCGWNNVERKIPRIHRNYRMRNNKLDQIDYVINPTPEQFFQSINMFIPKESQSPLQQFYNLVPNFVDVLRGEFVKRDNDWTIETIDPYSTAQAFEAKRKAFEQIVSQQAILEKQQTLASLGITEETDPQQYQFEMEKAMKQLTEVEMKAKNFRTTGAAWAEKVIKIQDKRYSMHELEPDAFESGLISDSEFWHIDMHEDDFKIELLNPMYCDYHKRPNAKYVSEGDYFLWFDFMSAGDIVNKYGRKMKEEDILKLKDIYVKTANLLIPDYLKSRQGEYYDLSKPWLQATDLNPTMNDALLGRELAYNFMRTPNFDHNIEVDIMSPIFGRMVTGHPQMFRVMRLYWRSMSRIGWLTKINRDGSRVPPQWIDENFEVTIEPEYDHSIIKEKTKDNLLYGEHIDWTWRNEWRHVIKISPNQKHTFWMNSTNQLQSIYIDGAPVPFQFQGRDNHFDALPPVEGCVFTHINSTANSFVDRLRPHQITYNICMNKVPRKFLEDKGLKIAVDKRSFPVNNSSNKTNGVDPREEYEDRLNDSQILEYAITKEGLEGMGQPALPEVINLSTAQEALFYLEAADRIKWMAGESIGITRQRLGQNKASETKYGIEQGIVYSEAQTEKYFEQHSNLMERFRQRMLDAAQYYSTFKETSREIYMNEMQENVFLSIEGMDNLLPHYNINLQSKANVRGALQTISQFLIQENTLDIALSAKIEALVSSSVPQILSVIKTSELEKVQREIAQMEAEQRQRQMEIQAQQEMQAQNLAHEDQQKELDRQTQLEIARIRALGGLQSDVNKNQVPDAQENLNASLKQQELMEKRRASQEELDARKQVDADKMILERERAAMELEKEKIKGEYALKVAKENKTNAEAKKKKPSS